VSFSSGNPEVGFQPYPDGPLEFVFELQSDGPRVASSFGVVLTDRHGARLVNADILTLGRELHLVDGRNLVKLTIEKLHLRAATYAVTLWVGDTVSAGYDLVEAAFQIDVVGLEQKSFGLTPTAEYGSVTCELSFEQL
jgi:hypothetical protein